MFFLIFLFFYQCFGLFDVNVPELEDIARSLEKLRDTHHTLDVPQIQALSNVFERLADNIGKLANTKHDFNVPQLEKLSKAIESLVNARHELNIPQLGMLANSIKSLSHTRHEFLLPQLDKILVLLSIVLAIFMLVKEKYIPFLIFAFVTPIFFVSDKLWTFVTNSGGNNLKPIVAELEKLIKENAENAAQQTSEQEKHAEKPVEITKQQAEQQAAWDARQAVLTQKIKVLEDEKNRRSPYLNGVKGFKCRGSYLVSGETLEPNQYLASPNRKFVLLNQLDGNLMLYSTKKYHWASWTQGNPGARFVVQSNGDLAIYNSGGVRIWNVNAVREEIKIWGWVIDHRRVATHVVLQDDGDLVAFSADNIPIWSSNTANSGDDVFTP